ncbi:MAG: 4-alpha-glucanotransferase [Alphaproteobacteria bacterium]|nr:4-alpha-glucanotransferase [Alphaproteobacteria bacterium]
MTDRRSGVLLHVSSLPGPYGIGDLGPASRDFVAWLASAKQRIWQVLPLTVVDPHGCPYASPTAFAREPAYISPDDLAEDGFVTHREKPYLAGDHVDWKAVRAKREPFLAKAATAIANEVELDGWRAEHPWVETWALFAALVDLHGPDWTKWPTDLRDLPKNEKRLATVRKDLTGAVARHAALQWAFDRQWNRLKALARSHDIQLWGDLPFFVGPLSADVWFHRELFDLDERGWSKTITGVPPDAFSPTGQLWHHPHFDRAAHAKTGWKWWVDRTAAAIELVDVLRLDHFRGLDGVWEVPAGDATAENGQWIDGPGQEALDALKERLGDLPLVAEDLGVITEPVRKLRDDARLPGMAILQFAFGGDPTHEFLPHNHRRNLVVYTGTHDNDTVAGWFRTADEASRKHALAYLHTDTRDIVWSMIRTAWRSVADTAIVPMQDLLSLGSDARMNVPGVVEGNWVWRLGREALNLSLASRLAEQTILSGRAGGTE